MMGTTTGVRVINSEQQYNVFQGTSNSVLLAFNPANYTWLGNVARNYAYYKVHNIGWTWVTSTATTDSGYINAGVFYERGEAKRWISSPSDTTLSTCQQFMRSPVWGGSATAFTGQLTNGENAQTSLVVDVKAAHNRTKQLIVSPLNQTSDLDAEYNQAIGAYLGFTWSSATPIDTIVGVWYITYDVEFFHPTDPSSQGPSMAVLAAPKKCGPNAEIPADERCHGDSGKEPPKPGPAPPPPSPKPTTD